MEILHVITDTNRRGAQIRALDLQDALGNLGCDVKTVALAPGSLDQGLNVPVLGNSRLGPLTLQALRRTLRRSDVAVAFGSTTLYACSVAAVSTSTKFVYRSIGEVGYWANTAAKRVRARLALKRADAVVALWPAAAEAITELFKVPSERIHIIPNAVDSSQFSPFGEDNRWQSRARYGLDPQGPVLLYMGSLSAEKNIDTVLRALVELPEYQLAVAGEGPQSDELRHRASQVAPGRVVFLGIVSSQEALPMADVVVLSSRSEGVPGVLIEAGFCGVPAVATGVGGIAQIVLDSQTGRILPPDASLMEWAEAIRFVLADRVRLGSAARRHCLANFEVRKVARRWLDLHQAITG